MFMDVTAYLLQISITKPLLRKSFVIVNLRLWIQVSVVVRLTVLMASASLPAAVFLHNPYWHISTSPK